MTCPKSPLFLLVLLVVVACAGGGGLAGASKDKGADKSTKTGSDGGGGGGGGDDADVASGNTDDADGAIEIEEDENARASDPVQVSGAFLTCGPAPAAKSLVASTDDAFGCGFFDGDGNKATTQPAITAVAATYPGAAGAAVALQPAPPDNRFQVVFGIPVDAAEGELQFAIVHETETGSGATMTTPTTVLSRDDGIKPCAAGRMRPSPGQPCDIFTPLYEYVKLEAGPGSKPLGYAYATLNTNPASNEMQDALAGLGFQKLEIVAMVFVARFCSKSYGCVKAGDAMPDGSVPIFLLKKDEDFEHTNATDAKAEAGDDWELVGEMMRLFSPMAPPDGAVELAVFRKGGVRRIFPVSSAPSGWTKGRVLGFAMPP